MWRLYNMYSIIVRDDWMTACSVGALVPLGLHLTAPGFGLEHFVCA